MTPRGRCRHPRSRGRLPDRRQDRHPSGRRRGLAGSAQLPRLHPGQRHSNALLFRRSAGGGRRRGGRHRAAEARDGGRAAHGGVADYPARARARARTGRDRPAADHRDGARPEQSRRHRARRHAGAAVWRFGAGDFTLDLDMAWSREEGELLPYRTSVLLASRAGGLEAPLDTVWTDLRDPEGFARSAATGRALGFQGKLCIHPDQVGASNAAFTPTAAAGRARACRRCRLRGGRARGLRLDPARRPVHRLPDRLPRATHARDDGENNP